MAIKKSRGRSSQKCNGENNQNDPKNKKLKWMEIDLDR